MCGICGLATATPAEFPGALLEAMCRTIVHRGPDDQGLHLGPWAALGARRLSIIDVQGGHQPLANEDGSIWAAHNGEVYNFPELRDELIARGHRFSTRTDTETLVHGYEEWGRDFVHKLRGMFAFAIADERDGTLLLVRDRLGIKPLYYTVLPDRTLVFGSELKAVLADPRVPREIEPRALDLYLTLEYIPAPLTIFRNIHKLPAASCLAYAGGRFEITKYWDISPDPEPAARLRRQDLAGVRDEIYARLQESVQLRLVSDVPLGAFLSGGIDSSAIVGLMRELGASPLRTFSIGFEDQSYDELRHARRIAERFETQHEELIIRPRALDLTQKLVRHLDEPLGDFSIFPTFLVSEMARRSVKVALSGDGGDEIFGGYEHYQAQKLAALGPVAAGGRAVSRALNRLPPAARKKGLWNKTQRFLQGLEGPPEARHVRWMSFLTPREKSSLYTADLRARLGGLREVPELDPFRELYGKLPGFDAVNAELYLDLQTYLVDDIMVKVDRMSMAASLEAREPLLDHRLVELAFSLPGWTKVQGLTTKWIFKKTVERLLPKDNIYRRKEGFSIPIKHWLRSELREMMLDRLSEKRVREGGLFEYGAVKGLIDAHLAGRRNCSHNLWALLVFEIWKENYRPSS